MKIAHIISYFQPMMGYQEYYLAKIQSELGHTVLIITSDRISKSAGKVYGHRYIGTGFFREEGVPVIRLPCLFEYASNNVIIGVKKVLKEYSPDVVHAHGVISPSTIMSLLLKNKLNYKIVVDSHMDYSYQSKELYRRLIFHFITKNPIFRKIIKTTDRFIAISDSVQRWVSIELGIKFSNIKKIPLGADVKIFSPNILHRNEIREKLNINENEILIIYAGRLVPKKEIEVLLFAATPLIQENREIKILLLGSGSSIYIKYLKNLVIKKNIKSNVIFHNFVHRKDLVKFYNAADLGVWTGRPSNTIQEAMSTGLPIIIVKRSMTKHLLGNRNGLSFPRGDIRTLRNHLRKIIYNIELRYEMGKRSRELVVNNFSWRVLTEKTITLYKDICSITQLHDSK